MGEPGMYACAYKYVNIPCSWQHLIYVSGP
jgi:hypothetical protein